MNSIDVLMARIYVSESSKAQHSILDYLKNTAKVRGVSVFRAIEGYGDTGPHASTILDMSFDLPLAIEFFDVPEKVESTIKYLSETINHIHIVSWKAKANH